jgi:hypothetical protein
MLGRIIERDAHGGSGAVQPKTWAAMIESLAAVREMVCEVTTSGARAEAATTKAAASEAGSSAPIVKSSSHPIAEGISYSHAEQSRHERALPKS